MMRDMTREKRRDKGRDTSRVKTQYIRCEEAIDTRRDKKRGIVSLNVTRGVTFVLKRDAVCVSSCHVALQETGHKV